MRVWRAPEGYDAKYVTVTASGEFILGYKKLSEIRKRYKPQIDLGVVEVVRELNNTYYPK